MKNIESLPKFSNYHEEGPTDNGYESLQDFFLSWTIRCAPSKFKAGNEKVQEYARRVVYTMIFGNNNTDNYGVENEIPNDFHVIKVTTKRQLSEIDLLAEVTAVYEGAEHKYILNIENKWYSSLRNGQLNKYRNFVDANYPNHIRVNLFITCDESRRNYELEKAECRKTNYKYLTIGDLASLTNMENDGITHNDLFDAYWFNS